MKQQDIIERKRTRSSQRNPHFFGMSLSGSKASRSLSYGICSLSPLFTGHGSICYSMGTQLIRYTWKLSLDG